MSEFVVASGKKGSKGAKALALALGTVARHRDHPMHQQAHWKYVINWGCSSLPYHDRQVINYPVAVARACDKIETLNALAHREVLCVPWTTKPEVAKVWHESGETVFARHVIRGTQGVGITIVCPADLLIFAPLYTMFIPNCDEYRVHVAFGKAINFQQKKKRKGVKADPYVKSHTKGWIFARQDVILPKGVEKESIKAVDALGLDFGAVDIMQNRDNKIAYVLEVNTAPGLDSEHSVSVYAEAFKNVEL